VEDNIIVTDEYDNIQDQPISSAIDIQGNSYSSFEEDCPILKSDHSDSALFSIKAFIKTNRYDRKQNDTIISYQLFKNFYCYDDGSAEYGYGLQGNNIAGATVAYRFPIYQQDTLIAVDIYFTPTVNNENLAYFNLYVWNDKSGIPYDSIGGKPECKTDFGHFVRYYLEKPILVPTTFYVGWQQIDETFLSVGYDRNTPCNSNILYNLDGTLQCWTVSSLRQKGALMIRPVFGKSSDMQSLLYNSSSTFTVYPNPAFAGFYLKVPEKENGKTGKLMIMDLTGKIYIARTIQTDNYISINAISSGLYIIKLVYPDGNQYFAKLIKK
jgi:hypothetical protein